MAEALGKANSLIAAGSYDAALEVLNAAIDADDTSVALHLHRALAHTELGHETEAAMDVRSAYQINAEHAGFTLTAPIFAKEKFKAIVAQAKPAAPAAAAAAPAAAVAAAPAPTKYKYDWYQTDKTVVVSVLMKNVKQEQIKVQFEDHSFSVDIALDGSSNYNLDLDVFGPILPAESTFKALATKVEIKLAKRDPVRWPKLEGDGTVTVPLPKMVSADEIAVKKPKNWDKLIDDEMKKQGEDKPEGDEALNALFKSIYSNASEETRRAMNKSFVESNGTVLSTNWSEVGKDKVETKPPEGMEFKKY
eukprot:m.231133 g.231133  ORF g.231133 m.231133 type:complete len:306 (+) comp12168_c0_seq1:18-935(+)